jgi:hypothetical protein
MNWSDFEKLLPSVVIGVVTAIVTVRLALVRFRTEKWWERKADAYTSIGAALFEYRRFCSEFATHPSDFDQLMPERRQGIGTKGTEAMEHVQRATAMGAFLLSRRAARALAQLQFQLATVHMVEPLKMFADQADILAEFAPRFLQLARRDLRLLPWWTRARFEARDLLADIRRDGLGVLLEKNEELKKTKPREGPLFIPEGGQ